ncbi:MAG: hypothetical protein OEL53_04475 [Rhodospirillales bacterium]|nr:hypothetical protein [Rhodospirillales bacterium]
MKKFVNPRFIKTIDLNLLRRLFERQPVDKRGLDIALFDCTDGDVRKDLLEFFSGPKGNFPKGLVADLHRIAELGTEGGMRLLLEQAERYDITIAPPRDSGGHPLPLDPKYVALLTFLDYRDVFDAACDLTMLEARASLLELAGLGEGVEPRLDELAKAAFERLTKEMLARELQGDYCRVGWYEDDDEINIVVTYGATITVLEVIEAQKETLASFQPIGHAVLSYSPMTGRVKVGGIAKANKAELAGIFATTMLGRSDFFAGADSRNLYTLKHVERIGLGFAFDHAFDRGILRVQIVEVQADGIATDSRTGEEKAQWSLLARDGKGNALARLAEISHKLVFGPDKFRLGHMTIRIHFATEGAKADKVTVKIKPPDTAAFKRHIYEGRIMELLKRNGLCHERDITEAAAAAQ